MAAAETKAEAAAREALAKVADILEPIGLQEEAELPMQILAEFVMDSRKKDKLLCSQLQALPKVEDAQRKQAKLREALEQLQAKKQMAMEKLRRVQKQWQLQQEKRLQHLAVVSSEVRERQTGTQQELEQLYQELGTLKQQAGQEQYKLQRHQTFLHLLHTLQGKLLFHEAEAEMPQELDLPKDKPQQLTQPQEQNIQDTMGRDECVSSKANNPQPAGDTGLPWLPGRQQHGEGS
ncbi:hypothetical protein EI555_004175 [Monodon monoceros]|uniref:ZW10 interacting kinetochore protein n=1 Tax=Monodon monoceros TaxID=40151 RepID=A0A4U1FHF2_MONMO|nr:hypothetical protein EI555_004175 [Monodon monoceros]